MENDADHGCPDAKISSSSSALGAVPQSLGIPVEEYLARADTKKLLSLPPLSSSSSSLLCGSGKDNNVVVVGDPALESVQQVVGGDDDEPSSGTHCKYIVELYQLCQRTEGLVPLFEIECDAQGASWGGKLIVGGRTISRGETRWQSKKAAREGLAEVGVGVVRGMMKTEDGKAKNWIGMLQGMYPYFVQKSGSSPNSSYDPPRQAKKKAYHASPSVPNSLRLPRRLREWGPNL